MTEEYGPNNNERRQNNINLEHRLTVVEQGVKHYDEGQKTIVASMSGLHKRFTDLKDTLCKKVKDTATKAEKNEENIVWLKGMPGRVFTVSLQVLGGVGVVSMIAFAIFRTIKMLQ